jgi:hypothetical protein
MDFASKRDYHLFTPHKHEPQLGSKVHYEKMGGYLFSNNSGYSFAHYFEKYYQSYSSTQEKDDENFAIFPNFEKFHTEVLPYIEALKDRVQLCNTLLDADDNEFVSYNKSDELITKPFPVRVLWKKRQKCSIWIKPSKNAVSTVFPINSQAQ